MSQAVADTVQRAHAARRLRAVVVNDTFRLAPWADLLYAADHGWWAEHPEAFGFQGSKLTIGNPFRGLPWLRNCGVVGFEHDRSGVRTGGNSGYQAVHVAAQAGARKILLLGFDMHGTHWHGQHAAPLRNTTEYLFGRWIERFETLAEELRELNVDVVNCTPSSALRCFRAGELTGEIEDGIRARSEPAACVAALPAGGV